MKGFPEVRSRIKLFSSRNLRPRAAPQQAVSAYPPNGVFRRRGDLVLFEALDVAGYGVLCHLPRLSARAPVGDAAWQGRDDAAADASKTPGDLQNLQNWETAEPRLGPGSHQSFTITNSLLLRTANHAPLVSTFHSYSARSSGGR